ncbi:PfkB family carbohydrate kinase [Jonesiaceae bacterium BS-20]|uniref:PfkB family carbohydrate kinase n=1 Tax=Jonesiaceae bacterium BS-20 TaxID=3120821 RepID=A0AAU7DUN6_9MICO
MPKPQLVYTGNVIVDLVLSVDGLPELGGDVIASSSMVTAGGGYNVMVAAARDNFPVTFAGQYGSGVFGLVVRKALADSGFSVVQEGLEGQDSGYCVALLDPSTERTFVTHVGAEGQLTKADLDRVQVREQDTVYVSGYSLAHPVNAASLPGWLAQIPKGATVITDPSPLIDQLAPQAMSQVLGRSNVLSANAREARLGSNLEDLAEAAVWFSSRIQPGGVVLIRDGANGCWVFSNEIGPKPVLVEGFEVAAVDTNGAGDAFGGVFAAEFSRGAGVLKAVRRANAAAALAVTQFGPATSPTAAQIDEFLAAQA